MKKFWPLIVIFIISVIFFWQFLLKGLLPIPLDTIVGLYYPFRDAYFKTNPNGLPYKNFLITDPVRQQYPWRNLSIESQKEGSLPLWNPYNFAGTPLLANFQSAPLYPLNILFFILPFAISWSILIFLQPLLAGIFLYLYLNNLKLNKFASLFGSVSFAFSGFFIAWLEWGTVLHTALWLPLILLSIDKILIQKNNFKFHPDLIGTNFKFLVWSLVLLLSLISSFFAGHLQTFFYLAILAIAYFLVRFIQYGKNIRILGLFSVLCLLFIVFTSFQWLPTIQFITLSARDLDVVGWREPGWFVPFQNLIQFIAPDFFGNPSTLNYFGIWNYGEFIGYVGILPLIMSFYALCFRKDKKTLFFGAVFFTSLIFALPTIFAKIPFKLDLPFFSTAQPTRLLFITDFSLSILAAFGLDYFMSLKNRKNLLYILGFFSVFFVSLWAFVLFLHGSLVSIENILVSKQNLIFPSVIFLISILILLTFIFYPQKNKFKKEMVIFLSIGLIVLTVIDLFRFGWKFEPFTNKEYLFPSTPVINFLKSKNDVFRIMSTDSRIMPPNFSVMYKLQTLDGYDPLYLQRFGELMAASGRGVPDIKPPFGFNRIITPQDPLSKIIDLLGVRYILSLTNIDNNSKLQEVYAFGAIKIYENKLAFNRVFFVDNTLILNSKQEAINAMFEVNSELRSRAVLENIKNSKIFQKQWSIGQASIIQYNENRVIIKTKNKDNGFLVLTDSYYPSWQAFIDGNKTEIYLTDYNFRGIIVPKGEHEIIFINKLF